MTEKFDVKTNRLFRPAAGSFEIVDVPPALILAADGSGNPNTSPHYASVVESLFAASYAIKFASKALGRDLVVPPLEGLWWAEDYSVDFATRSKDEWLWTVFIRQPSWLSEDATRTLLVETAEKKKRPGIAELRLETLDEGLCVQTLHVGAYDDEVDVIRRLHAEFLPANGLVERGKHHEIYLSDPRRVAPEKLRTILRQPVSRVT